jgi:pimeloyl-ACP methyl ester carboxylesterase
MRVLLFALLLSSPLAVQAQTAEPECVVLLHGLSRSESSFLVMEETLAALGYRVVNSDYDSTAAPVVELAEEALPEAFARCEDAETIHFVTHSMGAILLRAWAEANAMPPGRTVMLAPPNQGSELVDTLEAIPPFEWLNGPAGGQLGTDGIVTSFGPVWPGVGVIAGSRSLAPAYSAILPGPDDGKVTVASTRVAGMEDHLTLPVTHTFLMNAPLVIAQVLAFLEEGQFDPDMSLGDVIEALVLE